MRFIIFGFLCEFGFLLLRTETQGTEDDWEQIDAMDIGENNRDLSDRTLDIFLRVCGTKKWDGG